MKDTGNRLYYGDCLEIMQSQMKLGSVDLIYLDPPFNSNRAYNAIYEDSTGHELPEQVNAFCDLWEMNEERERVLKAMPVLMREAGADDAAAELWKLWMNALRKSQPKLLAYLLYMTERLIVMKGLLKPTGSIYLHCDPTASHYIKIIMDSIFGHQNFQNEIIWSYRRWPAKQNRYQSMHDTILFYTKTQDPKKRVFNTQYEPPSESYVKRFKGKTQVLDPETKTRKLVVDEETKGMPLRDVWNLSILAGSSKERLGYPTQKPVALLKRIIEVSTDPGQVVFDPFCGCATTIAAAHELNRKWIGIDIAFHAIRRVVQKRLEDNYGLVEGTHYRVDGIPLTPEAAQDLWQRDKYQFQRWAVEYIDGFVTSKRTADGGVDGRLFFHHPDFKELQSMVIEVKGGKHVGIEVLRALRGVLDTETATMAGLIVMDDLSDTKRRNFVSFMGQAGDLDVMGVKYPRMQMLSVQDILNGKRFLTPSVAKLASQHSLPLLDTR